MRQCLHVVCMLCKWCVCFLSNSTSHLDNKVLLCIYSVSFTQQETQVECTELKDRSYYREKLKMTQNQVYIWENVSVNGQLSYR